MVWRPLPLWDVVISLHTEESRRFVYAQKVARPTAPCYNNEWLVCSIYRVYPSISLHQADPTYFNCPSTTIRVTKMRACLNARRRSGNLTVRVLPREQITCLSSTNTFLPFQVLPSKAIMLCPSTIQKQVHANFVSTISQNYLVKALAVICTRTIYEHGTTDIRSYAFFFLFFSNYMFFRYV